jgi:hypothetical protein
MSGAITHRRRRDEDIEWMNTCLNWVRTEYLSCSRVVKLWQETHVELHGHEMRDSFKRG